MEITLGKRIANLRKEKGYTQEGLAEKLGVSPQAVSKWENDQTCPDISILPLLAEMLGVSIDELLTGKSKDDPVVHLATPEFKKDFKDMMLRIVVDSCDGDRVRVNLPMLLVEAVLEMGMDMSMVTGNKKLEDIDFSKIIQLARQGLVGNLVEVDSADGDKIRIFVE